MLRFHYPMQQKPPAPFVYLTLRNPLTATELRDVAAPINTATDRTLLPSAVVRALGLSQMSTMMIGGVGGTTQSMPTYPVILAIDDLSSQSLEIAANEEEPWVLLGRDVINAYRTLLDGPQLALEID